MRVAITGASSGIGAEVAARFFARGDEVVAFDVNEPSDHVSRWVKTDLNDLASIEDVVASVDGPFDALINNAGLPPRPGNEEMVLRVNYFGLVTFLDAMLAKLSPGASIVNTASRAGAKWQENLDEVKALRAIAPAGLTAFLTDRKIDATRAYNLSKEAVIVMTMARTGDMLERGFRMNSVSPAAVSTEILDDFMTAFGDRVAQNVARVGRPGQASEVADVIAFLAAPESHWIKGQDIVIDGGMSALIASDALGI